MLPTYHILSYIAAIINNQKLYTMENLIQEIKDAIANVHGSKAVNDIILIVAPEKEQYEGEYYTEHFLYDGKSVVQDLLFVGTLYRRTWGQGGSHWSSRYGHEWDDLADIPYIEYDLSYSDLWEWNSRE